MPAGRINRPSLVELIDALQRPGFHVGHYTTAEAAFGRIVPAGTLKMSPYREMRDPLENQLLPLTPTGPEEERFCEHLNRERGRVRIVSLTRDDPWPHDREQDEPPPRAGDVFGCCWARPRMWEQYGDRHRGACLVFDYHLLVLGKQALRDLDLIGHGDVTYRDDGLANLDAEIGPKDPSPENLQTILSGHFEALFLRKSSDWRAEHELRILARRRDRRDYERMFGDWPHPGEPEDDPMPEMLSFAHSGSLLAVVVGHDFPDWQIGGAKEACQRRAVPLLQVDWKTGKPRLHTARQPA